MGNKKLNLNWSVDAKTSQNEHKSERHFRVSRALAGSNHVDDYVPGTTRISSIVLDEEGTIKLNILDSRIKKAAIEILRQDLSTLVENMKTETDEDEIVQNLVTQKALLAILVALQATSKQHMVTLNCHLRFGHDEVDEDHLNHSDK